MISNSPLLNRTLAGVLIPFGLLVAFLLFQMSGLVNQQKKQLINELKHTLHHVDNELKFHLGVTTQMAQILSGHDTIITALSENQGHLLYQWGKQIISAGLATRVSFVNASGIVLARGHQEFRFNDRFKQAALLDNIRSSAAGLSYLFFDDGIWLFRAAVPVFQYDIVYKGMILVEKEISVSFLDDTALMFGLTTVRLEKAPPLKNKSPAPDGGVLFASAGTALMDEKGNSPFNLVISKDASDQMARIQRLNRLLITLTMGMALTAVVVIFLAVRFSLKPVRIMHHYLDRFRDGSLTLPELMTRLTPLTTQKDELGLISDSFIKTLAQIKNYQENLEEQVRERTHELQVRTDQLAREMKIRQEKQREYRLVVENAADAIFLVQESKVIFPNPKTFELFGVNRSDFSACTFFDFIAPDHRKRIAERNQAILEGMTDPQTASFELVHPKGSVWVQLNTIYTDWGDRPATLNFMRDITELRKAQQNLVQSEKMLSIGGLAAGMAHEINNPLAGMMQNAQVVINRLSQDMPANLAAADRAGISMAALKQYMNDRKIISSLELINTAGQQAAEIVENMLNFSKNNSTGKSGHDIRTILDNSLVLAENDYDLKQQYDFKTIQIEKQYDPKTPDGLCESSKIQQVFFNILKNSAQAFKDRQCNGSSPRIILRTYQENKFVCVQIEDNGPGMDEKTRKKIFEPFFTTKPVDVGTGLGLFISYFIVVEDHSGMLDVEPARSRGTCFTVRLPAIEKNKAGGLPKLTGRLDKTSSSR